jgi:hypothetical protein
MQFRGQIFLSKKMCEGSLLKVIEDNIENIIMISWRIFVQKQTSYHLQISPTLPNLMFEFEKKNILQSGQLQKCEVLRVSIWQESMQALPFYYYYKTILQPFKI